MEILFRTCMWNVQLGIHFSVKVWFWLTYPRFLCLTGRINIYVQIRGRMTKGHMLTKHFLTFNCKVETIAKWIWHKLEDIRYANTRTGRSRHRTGSFRSPGSRRLGLDCHFHGRNVKQFIELRTKDLDVRIAQALESVDQFATVAWIFTLNET